MPREVSREEWESKGRDLFGADQATWRFACPACKREMSIERVRSEFGEHLPRLREGDFRVEQECLGRYVPTLGCDWAAYGLFQGPLSIDGVPAFDFGGLPFTGQGA